MRKRRINGSAATRCRRACTIALLLAAASIGGCSRSDRPSLGAVHGRITLDGRPLAGANIGFVPQRGGRESYGFTDHEGKYELVYLRDIMGAKVGRHAVRISTAHDRALKTETVPAKYNVRTTLEKEVVAGDNVIDFDLTR